MCVSEIIHVADESLSSWRAWIEIWDTLKALMDLWSLSSWRAWIEIDLSENDSQEYGVALLMESVD